MLGNCILRNPSTNDGELDKGSLCESLLFFSKTHLLIDMATLAAMARSDFLDVLVVMLKEGYLTGNYSPQATGLHTDNRNGVRESFFTVFKFGGDQKKPNMRNPELMETQLARIFEDKAKARKYFRLLADLISFDDLEDNGVPSPRRDGWRVAKPVVLTTGGFRFRLRSLSYGGQGRSTHPTGSSTIPLTLPSLPPQIP